MREPDYKGEHGRAWKVDIDKALADVGTSRDEDGLVATWIINQPLSHPIWPWYRLILIHLRPHPKFPDPTIHLAGATHEFHLQALNPDCYPPNVDEWPSQYMTPTNYGDQILCTSDEAAVKTIEELAIKPIVNGHLIADTDYIRQWIGIFGGHLMKR